MHRADSNPACRSSRPRPPPTILAARQLKDHPDNSPDGLRIIPLAEASLPPQAQTIVWSIMALAGFVLLIACANLANLQFARTAARGREFAIRGAWAPHADGCSRQLLSESLVLAFLGGVLGLVVAHWSNELLQRQFVFDSETILNLPLNLRVLLFALAASTASGLAFGLVPAWLASRTDVNDALKQGSRGTTGDRAQHRVQHSLIVAEVALAMMLLAGAGLVVTGLRSFAGLDPGWKVDGLTLGYLTLPEGKYGDGNALRAFADRLEERLAAIPGVQQAAVCWNLPVRQFNVGSSFTIDGRPEPPKGAPQGCSVNGVTPGYFKTLGMPVAGWPRFHHRRRHQPARRRHHQRGDGPRVLAGSVAARRTRQRRGDRGGRRQCRGSRRTRPNQRRRIKPTARLPRSRAVR